MTVKLCFLLFRGQNDSEGISASPDTFLWFVGTHQRGLDHSDSERKQQV